MKKGEEMSIRILYEDNHLIVCVKPPGILSQASEMDYPDMLTLLKKYIKDKYQKPGNVFCGLVHRLDLNVGGVMVFAKTSKGAKRLSEQIRNHAFHKRYLAVSLGDSGSLGKRITLDNYMKKDKKRRKAIITNNLNDKRATLIYQPLEKVKENHQVLTLNEVELITGRFHQIRAQFSYYHFPLFGDNKYGPKTYGYELGLYAYQLSFKHPITKDNLVFTHYPDMGVFQLFKTLNERTNHEQQSN